MRPSLVTSRAAARVVLPHTRPDPGIMRHKYVADLSGRLGLFCALRGGGVRARQRNGECGAADAALVSGLAVLAMIYTLGRISAAHFNPAVSLGFAVARRFPWRYVVPYWGAQVGGAVLACGFLTLLFGLMGGRRPATGHIFHWFPGGRWAWRSC